MTVMPATARGPLPVKVMEQLSAWLAAERYTSTMVPLRHTAAMNLVAEGVDISVIAFWLGHQRTVSDGRKLSHSDGLASSGRCNT